MKSAALLLALLLLGCGDGGDPQATEDTGLGYECDGPGARFVTDVTEHEFGSGQDYGQDEFPAPVLGPPKGGGSNMGTLDVTSIGEGGFVTLAFAGNVIVDGPGADFIVFENAFAPAGAQPEDVYAELASVMVSQDGESWSGYECEPRAYPYEGCAGWHAVLANADKNDVDPLDPEVAGGDAFDLEGLGLEWARYVRLEDMPDDDARTFDLDAAAIVNAGCE